MDDEDAQGGVVGVRGHWNVGSSDVGRRGGGYVVGNA